MPFIVSICALAALICVCSKARFLINLILKLGRNYAQKPRIYRHQHLSLQKSVPFSFLQLFLSHHYNSCNKLSLSNVRIFSLHNNISLPNRSLNSRRSEVDQGKECFEPGSFGLHHSNGKQNVASVLESKILDLKSGAPGVHPPLDFKSDELINWRIIIERDDGMHFLGQYFQSIPNKRSKSHSESDRFLATTPERNGITNIEETIYL